MQRLLAWLGLSLAIHAGVATVALHALGGTELPVLFIDLRELADPGGDTPPAGSRHGEGATSSGPSPPARTQGRRGAPPTAARSAVPVADASRESPSAMTPAAPLEPGPAPASAPPRAQLDAAPVPEPGAAPAPMENTPPVLPSGPARPTGADRGESVPSPAGSSSAGAGTHAGSAAAGGSATIGGSGVVDDIGPGGAGARDGAALARGTPGDGAGDGVPDMMYDELLRRIRRALVYPSQARQRRLMGVVEVVLEIHPSGAITQVTVVASSSHQILDEAAVETLRGLGRLPFPPGVRPRKLSVRVPVVYELR